MPYDDIDEKSRVDVKYVASEGPDLGVVDLPPQVAIATNATGHAALKDRASEFVELNRKNLDNLGGNRPRYIGQVKNVIDGGEMTVDITYRRTTEHWAADTRDQVPSLKRLSEVRAGLEDIKVWVKTDDDLRDNLVRLLGLPEDSRKNLVATFEVVSSEP